MSRHRELLEKHTDNIQNNLRSSIVVVVDELYSKSIIDQNQKADILVERIDYKKVDALLKILKECEAEAFNAFLSAVEKVNPELAKAIQD